MWESFVELLRATIFSTAHLFGGSLGGGIIFVSAGVRLALLPLTLRLARRDREHQARIATLKPQIDALQRRYAKDPRRVMAETRALYQQHDIRLMRPSSLIGIAIQIPLLSGLLAAVRKGLGAKVRFLWIPDLARPEGTVLLGVTALSAWVAFEHTRGAGANDYAHGIRRDRRQRHAGVPLVRLERRRALNGRGLARVAAPELAAGT